MSTYPKMIDSITQALLQNSLTYRNTVIVGENSSGKSQILKELMKICDKKKYYFIDSVNRKFDVQTVELEPLKNTSLEYNEKINENRIRDDVFNMKDTFCWKGQITNHIGEVYPYFSQELNGLLQKFCNINLQIKKDIEKVSYINGNIMAISNGYQAIIRIFIEILFYTTYTTDIKDRTIIIDEIDEYLHPKNNAKILKFLIQEFPDIRFIVTTHSADLIASVDKCNLIVLDNDSWERLDSGDYSSVSYANSLFSQEGYKRAGLSQKQIHDINIRKLLNNKLSGIWTEEDQEMLDSLKKEELTKTQQLLLYQIEGK